MNTTLLFPWQSVGLLSATNYTRTSTEKILIDIELSVSMWTRLLFLLTNRNVLYHSKKQEPFHVGMRFWFCGGPAVLILLQSACQAPEPQNAPVSLMCVCVWSFAFDQPVASYMDASAASVWMCLWMGECWPLLWVLSFPFLFTIWCIFNKI